MDVFGEWRDVPGYEGHLQVSFNGFIKQFRNVGGYWWAPKKPAPNPNGYVIIYDNKNPLRVHTLVALAFIGPRPNGCTVDHIDRNRSNNVATNLRWATKAEQIANRDKRQSREKISFSNRLPEEEFREWSDSISVSQFGRLLMNGCIYKPVPGKRDYACISKNRQTFQFHRVVADVWADVVGAKPSERHTVDHIDRDRSNNAASNLRWATPSEQALNRHKPEKRSAAQVVDQIAVDVAAPYTNCIDWVKYDSLGDAALGVSRSIPARFTHNQIGQIVAKYPNGHTATKGVAEGWSFRLHKADADPSAVPAKKAKVTRNQTPVPVDVQAPTGGEWIHYASSLAAAKGIMKQFGVKIAPGSISRFVNSHPNGHTVESKQNAGWSFRLHR